MKNLQLRGFTARVCLLVAAALGGGGSGCFARELTLGDHCRRDSDCGLQGVCEERFCGGCNVIDPDLNVCLCTVDLEWNDPEAAYDTCYSTPFPAPDAPTCVSGMCAAKDDGVPRCNFAFAVDVSSKQADVGAVSVAIPICESSSDPQLCFEVVDEPSATCKASGSNTEVVFRYDKDRLGSHISTLGIVCELVADISECDDNTADSCNSISLGSEMLAMGEAPMGDEYASCGGVGPEAVFRWTAPATGTYVFDTAGSEFDTVLYLRLGESCDGEELACNDDTETAESTLQTSRIEYPLDAGEAIMIFVDSFYVTSGHFVLTITQVA